MALRYDSVVSLLYLSLAFVPFFRSLPFDWSQTIRKRHRHVFLLSWPLHWSHDLDIQTCPEDSEDTNRELSICRLSRIRALQETDGHTGKRHRTRYRAAFARVVKNRTADDYLTALWSVALNIYQRYTLSLTVMHRFAPMWLLLLLLLLLPSSSISIAGMTCWSLRYCNTINHWTVSTVV